VITAKGKRKRMDRDDECALHQLDHVVRDALMSVLFEKRAHYRSQYDGDEKRQQKGRNERRSRQAKKGKAELHCGNKYREPGVKRPSREPGRARTESPGEPGRDRRDRSRKPGETGRARESPESPEVYIYTNGIKSCL
jgi:hypothetical protein